MRRAAGTAALLAGLGLLGPACGGGSASPTGGGAGGATGTAGAGASGTSAAGVGGGAGGTSAAGTGGGAGGAPCATDFQPCEGGEALVGTWVIDPRCEPPGQVQSANSCQGETFDFTKVLSKETWVFRADLTMTLTLAASGPATIVVPDTCLQAMSPPLACTDAGAGASWVQRLTFPGGKASSPSCQDAGGTCTCALSIDPAPMNGNGTYTIAGATLTASLGDQNLVFDSCATATTLKLRAHNSNGSLGNALVFEKQ
jgi:hypothetical protein